MTDLVAGRHHTFCATVTVAVWRDGLNSNCGGIRPLGSRGQQRRPHCAAWQDSRSIGPMIVAATNACQGTNGLNRNLYNFGEYLQEESQSMLPMRLHLP
eukprot:5031096-Amphidinium_carterae.1